jgi:hypothetical protein
VVDGEPVKFEIILEARIEVKGTQSGRLLVPALDRASCFAEKWLANADRWNDVSVLSRDAIDLAFMLHAWQTEDAQAGAAIAAQACGTAIRDAARSAAAKLVTDVAYRKHCALNLAVTNAAGLRTGLKKLEKFSAAM